jgi:hypothetical protein
VTGLHLLLEVMEFVLAHADKRSTGFTARKA